ncbi:MAG: class I SAM-dependent methyltransferase [Pyrinomonadaceae bacterium]|nr:class I SAM-dependent methyltransferase [Pyrinomonadaceae bacterium]
MEFKDYFSTRSSDYAKYRPRYPEALFERLASLCRERETAWDCATGNGQAAEGLSPYFDRVIATDASKSQIENAVKRENIIYKVATAEGSGIDSHTIDLVTVAQALHWFDLDSFYGEVKRVLKPAGVLAVWMYNLLEVSPEIDAIVNRYYTDTVGAYWPAERSLIEDHYRAVDFPFAEIETPPFAMEMRWSLAELLGYLRTWSATKRFAEAHGFDPVESLAGELRVVWGAPEDEKLVRWPLDARAGVVPH